MQNQVRRTSGSVRTADDPTEAILSQSGLHCKALCDYVINVATGCRHGCKFCYVPSTPNIRARPDMLAEEVGVDDGQTEWGSYVLYRDNLGDRLDAHLERKRTWNETRKGCGVVGISFSTDCYMDGRAGAITRDVIIALSRHRRYARILTRNPILALQDDKTFRDAGEYVTIGSSIPSLHPQEVTAIEPSAPAPTHRLRGLKEFADMGVQTYVSMSPTYPTQTRDDLKNVLKAVAEVEPAVVFHEPINPRGGNFEMCVEAARQAGQSDLADALAHLRDTGQWVEYSLSHLCWVQELGDELGLPIHLWPDKRLIRETSGAVREWLESWYERQSPEQFADRTLPIDEPPPIPKPLLERNWDYCL